MKKFVESMKIYIIENNKNIHSAKIISSTDGLYLIRFEDGSGTRIKEHRFFETKEEAEEHLPEGLRPKKGFRSPYDYEM